MSKFARFMKANKAVKENGTYAATKSLCDEDGQPILWEFKHITSKENEAGRDGATRDIPVAGRQGVYRQKLDSTKYVRDMIVKSVVCPDLYDKELQDSYGVNTPEELLYELVDDPGEYMELAAFVQRFQGFDVSFDDMVEEAKN